MSRGAKNPGFEILRSTHTRRNLFFDRFNARLLAIAKMAVAVAIFPAGGGIAEPFAEGVAQLAIRESEEVSPVLSDGAG